MNPAPSPSSSPRKRRPRATAPSLALDSRVRENDDEIGDGARAAEPRVCLGVVGAPHGVRGLVRIKSFTGEPAAIAGYGALEDETGARQFTLKVIGPAKGDGMIVAKVSGIADRDRADALR